MRAELVVLLSFACVSALPAQGRAGRGAQSSQGPPPGGDSAAPNRATLEQRVRQRIAQVTRKQLGLTDAQMAKLEETNRKFDEKRRLIVDQERDIRMAMRDEMLRPDSARQGQIAALLDRVNKTQRQRLDIAEQEQKELSGFLTPLQRAKYFAIEQQVRQRVNQMRQQQLQQPGRGGRAGRMGRGQQPMKPPRPANGRGRGVQPPPAK